MHHRNKPHYIPIALTGVLLLIQTHCSPRKEAAHDTISEWITITPAYPKPLFCCGVLPQANIPNLEKPDGDTVKKRLSFKVPKGAANVALGKPVMASVKVIAGSLQLFTDGDAQGFSDTCVELVDGLQWIQIDLGSEFELWEILLWHYAMCNQVYFDVIVQCSNDPDFKNGVTTLYNNDFKGEAGFGKGADPCYVETNYGRLIDGKGTRARYVRFYGNGSISSSATQWVEAYIYGIPPSKSSDQPK